MVMALRAQFKLVTFDRSVIHTRWRKMNERPLGKAGAMVRMVARGSIKRRSTAGRPSPRGTPPFSHAGGATPPFKMIFNVPHRRGNSEIVGMVGFGPRRAPVPGLHEHGGWAERRVFENTGVQRRTKKGRIGRYIWKARKRMVRYPERAFMLPALLRVRHRMPHLWRNSLGRIAGRGS